MITVTVKMFVAFEKNCLLVRKQVEITRQCTHRLGSSPSLGETDVESTFCFSDYSNDPVRVGRNSSDSSLNCDNEISNWRRRGKYSGWSNRHFWGERIGRRCGHGSLATHGALATDCPGEFIITSSRCVVSMTGSVVNSCQRDEARWNTNDAGATSSLRVLRFPTYRPPNWGSSERSLASR